MRIREIEKKDNLAIAAIIRKSLEDAGLNIPGTAYFDKQLTTLYEFYHDQPNSRYWVLVDEKGHVHGGIGIGIFEGKTAEVQKLYVSPNVLGQGWGRKLLEQGLNYARDHFEYVYLETFSSLKAANQLYLKSGFETLEKPSPLSQHNACDAWFLKKL